MCKRNVQTGCTGYVHIAAMRMMENGCFLQFIKLSPVDVMRLSLGAWWPEGRSSSSVSQFLPSCSWSACQMAVWWKDGFQGDLSPWLFLQLCFCSVWGRCPAERGGQWTKDWVKMKWTKDWVLTDGVWHLIKNTFQIKFVWFVCRICHLPTTYVNRWAGLNRQRCRGKCWSSSAKVVFNHTITS